MSEKEPQRERIPGVSASEEFNEEQRAATARLVGDQLDGNDEGLRAQADDKERAVLDDFRMQAEFDRERDRKRDPSRNSKLDARQGTIAKEPSEQALATSEPTTRVRRSRSDGSDVISISILGAGH